MEPSKLWPQFSTPKPRQYEVMDFCFQSSSTSKQHRCCRCFVCACGQLKLFEDTDDDDEQFSLHLKHVLQVSVLKMTSSGCSESCRWFDEHVICAACVSMCVRACFRVQVLL